MDVYGKLKDKISSLKKTYQSGNQQTDNLGKELAARAEMTRQAQNPPEPETPLATPPSPASWETSGGKYGDRSGEKRLDTKEMTKPLGSYKNGTPAVPKTGIYKLHKGEAVVPAEKNPMNPYAKITQGDRKPRKAIKAIHVTATDNGKHIVTHKHHYPQHHEDSTHAMNSVEELTSHMAKHGPMIEPQAPEQDNDGDEAMPNS